MVCLFDVNIQEHKRGLEQTLLPILQLELDGLWFALHPNSLKCCSPSLEPRPGFALALCLGYDRQKEPQDIFGSQRRQSG